MNFSSRNQTKPLLGIETIVLTQKKEEEWSRNQTKPLLGIETLRFYLFEAAAPQAAIKLNPY